jgi:hypothetical protein
MKLVNKEIGEISKNENFKERYEFLNKSEHNYLRISRILRFLGIIGLESFKINFLKHMINETLSELLISNCVPSLVQYWLPTLLREEDLEELEILIFKLTKRKVDRNQFFLEDKSWSFQFEKKKLTPEMIKQQNEIKKRYAKEKAFEMKKKKNIESILSKNLEYKKIYDDHLMCRKDLTSENLIVEYPPKFYSTHKQFLFDLTIGCQHEGKLEFSRYLEMKLPSKMNLKTSFEFVENFYDYKSSLKDSEMDWWVNFADEYLFCGYSFPLFAQDEIMVAEHPILSSLKEYLDVVSYKNVKFSPYTSNTKTKKYCTPILIQRAQRMLSVNTFPTEGNDIGIYGNNFKNSTFDQIKNATTILSPTTFSNIIAMEAPRVSVGLYTKDQIRYAIQTAFTGFFAAKLETFVQEKEKIFVHTGDWGTGAFGGNKILMCLTQMISANLAEIDIIYFHSIHSDSFEEAKRIFGESKFNEKKIDTIIQELEDMKFNWGVSDGN